MEAKRRCGWLPRDRDEKPSVVWASPIASPQGPRLALTECPVSYLTGESSAWLEDFCAHLLIPSSANLLGWSARRVDAFALLWKELQETEKSEHA